MKYIASVSWGKDSLAMLLILIENNYTLDEVVFYDTGMEFQAIYDTRDKVLPLLAEKGIKYTELKPDRPFLYDMLERPKIKRTGEKVCGDGWCGGACRWGTFAKQRALNKYCGNNITYIGLAADEEKRLHNLEPHKKSPIARAGLKEANCLEYCYSKGFYWEENGVRLYDILDRVSCWCCANKNAWELWNMWYYLPQYWEKLKEMQSKIDKPMKKLCNKKFGEYGNVFDLEKVFESGYVPKHRGKELQKEIMQDCFNLILDCDGVVFSSLSGVVGKGVLEEIILKPIKNSHGYLQVDLCLSGKMKHHKIHRLVAEAFIPKSDESKNTVNHIDYNKFNNRVDNLEWLSNRENVQDYFKKKSEREG